MSLASSGYTTGATDSPMSLSVSVDCVCVCVCVCGGAVSGDIVYVVGGKGKGMVYCTGVWLAVVSDKDEMCSLVNKTLLCNFSVWITCLFCSCSRFPLTNKLTR